MFRYNAENYLYRRKIIRFFSPFCWTQVQEHYSWVDQVSRYLEINVVKSENFHCFPIIYTVYIFSSFFSSFPSTILSTLICKSSRTSISISLVTQHLSSFLRWVPHLIAFAIFTKKTIRFPMPNLTAPNVCGTRFNVGLVTLNWPVLNGNLYFRVSRQFCRLRSREHNNRLFNKICLSCNGNLS
jgi:hypothetical protein